MSKRKKGGHLLFDEEPSSKLKKKEKNLLRLAKSQTSKKLKNIEVNKENQELNTGFQDEWRYEESERKTAKKWKSNASDEAPSKKLRKYPFLSSKFVTNSFVFAIFFFLFN